MDKNDKILNKYRESDGECKYILKPLPNGDVERHIGLIPETGFGLKPTLDELGVKIEDGIRNPAGSYVVFVGGFEQEVQKPRGSYVVFVTLSCGDAPYTFRGLGKTRDEAINDVLDEVHLWINHSMYASDYRSKLGIMDTDYLIKPGSREYLKLQNTKEGSTHG